jgi:hypothetical protein
MTVMVLLTAWVCAQTPSDQGSATKTPPPGPLIISKMPDFSQWTIDIAYTDRPKPGETSAALAAYTKAAQTDPVLAKAMANPQFVLALRNLRPVHIRITKTGKIRHEERDMEEGGKGELWWIGDYIVERSGNSPTPTARNVAGWITFDFPELDWITKETFIGIQANKDRKCLAFKTDVYSESDHMLLGTKYAFVDFATRCPVSYQYLAETRNYTFLPPPTSALDAPQEFVAAAQAADVHIRRATPHLGPP